MKEFVITHRNKDNNKFHVLTKKEYQNFKKTSQKSLKGENIKDENFIVKQIDQGIEFYLYDKLNDSYTPVLVSKIDIKTKGNNTLLDNIGSLPLFEIKSS